ncbi:cytochrome P450 2D6-like [Branchiostoma floridae x Branchiostoma belcheri]
MGGGVQWMTESVQEIFQISGLNLQTVLVLCGTFLFAWYLLNRPRNLPPYPAGSLPVIGHLLALGRTPHHKLTAWRRQYGDVFTVRMGMEDVVVLNGYAAVKDALVDRSELFASRPPHYILDAVYGFGKDILTVRWGTVLKQRRRFAFSTFKSLGMKVGKGSIEGQIQEEANCLRHRMVEYEEKPFDISHDLDVAVANVICGMEFGKRYEFDDETFHKLLETITSLIAEFGSAEITTVYPFLRFIPGMNRAYNRAMNLSEKIQGVIWDEIARHRENLDRENPRDFLDYFLLEVEKQERVEGLTEEIVMYTAQDMFLAGTETTTNTLLWSLIYMTSNPGIQKKVQQELDAVVGDGQPTLSHRPQLPYVNACLLETMRIRTLLPLSVPHATSQDVKVQEFDIPEGTKILLNMQSVHMDSAYWPDPERFDPERFLDAEGNVINKPDSFLPFGGGRRVCLGEQLAKMELFLFFSTLLQSFTFKLPEGAPPPNTDGVLGITLKPLPFKLCAIQR